MKERVTVDQLATAIAAMSRQWNELSAHAGMDLAHWRKWSVGRVLAASVRRGPADLQQRYFKCLAAAGSHVAGFSYDPESLADALGFYRAHPVPRAEELALGAAIQEGDGFALIEAFAPPQ